MVSRDAPSLLSVVSKDTRPESTFGSATQTITKVKSDNPENIKQDILMGLCFFQIVLSTDFKQPM